MVGDDKSIFVLVLMILAFIVLVLWVFLPFAIFGIKDKLDILINLQSETNKLLIESEKSKVKRNTVSNQKVRKVIEQVDSRDIWPSKDNIN